METFRPPHLLIGSTLLGAGILAAIIVFYNSMNLWVARVLLFGHITVWVFFTAVFSVFVLHSRAYQNKRDLC